MKYYDFEITIEIQVCSIEAGNIKQAIKELKEDFYKDFNMELKDDNIKEIK